jgi:hypothetical protein
VFEDRVLRKIFERRTDGVSGEWRRLHIEKLYALCFLSNIIRVIKSVMKWDGHVARMGKEDRRTQVFDGKTRGKEATWKSQVKMGG